MHCNKCLRDLPDQLQCPYCSHITKKSKAKEITKGIVRYVLGFIWIMIIIAGIRVIIDGIQNNNIGIFTGPLFIFIPITYLIYLKKTGRLRPCGR